MLLHRTTHQPRHHWGHARHDAHISIIDPVCPVQSCLGTDAAVAVGPTKLENRATVIDEQTAHRQDEHRKADWHTQRRRKRSNGAENPIVPGPIKKQLQTLMDLWVKKKGKTNQTKEAPRAEPKGPGRGYQSCVPASSWEAQIRLDSQSHILEPAQQRTKSTVTCTSNQISHKGAARPAKNPKTTPKP